MKKNVRKNETRNAEIRKTGNRGTAAGLVRRMALTGGLACALACGSFSQAGLPMGIIQVMADEGAQTFSKYWYQDEQGNWKVKDSAGNMITNAWLCDDAVAANGKEIWYLLDTEGNMVTAGLVQDGTGNYYSLETSHDGHFGMLRHVNGTYDGIALSLEESHNGSFASVLNQDGLEALRAKYGVTVVSMDNSHIVYTSSFAEAGGSSLVSRGGGSGGGSGSGSGGSGGGSGRGSSSGGSSSGGSTSGNSNLSAAERQAVEEFKAAYIRDDMTDFEKEIWIIRYLAETVEYVTRSEGGSVVGTSYGALVEKKAVCDGYSKAFQVLADACGLTACRVTGTGNGGAHSWNQICLDGEWYHVDPTWEDPISSVHYGIDHVRNEYINLTDEQMKETHSWSGGHTCSSTRYNWIVTEYYLLSGEVDTDMGGDRWRRYLIYSKNEENGQFYLRNAGYMMDDGSNCFWDTENRDAIDRYLVGWFTEGYPAAYLVTSQETELDWLTPNYMKSLMGGDSWQITLMERRNENGKAICVYKVSLLDGQGLMTQEDVRKLLEAASLPDGENVFGTRDEAAAYVKAAVEQCRETLTLVYRSETELHSAASILSSSRADLSNVSCVSKKTVKVDGQVYTICTYELEYRGLEDKLGAYLTEDKKNLAATNEEADAYLSERLKERTGQTDRFYVVFGPDAQVKEKEEIQRIAEASGAVVKSVDRHVTRKEYQGQTWTAVEYSIVYEGTLEEIIASSSDFKAHPEAAGENFFDVREEGALPQIKARVEEAVEAASEAGDETAAVYFGICADSTQDIKAALEELCAELEAEGYGQCIIGAPGSSGKAYEHGVVAVWRVTVRCEQPEVSLMAEMPEKRAAKQKITDAAETEAENVEAAEVETEEERDAADTDSALEAENAEPIESESGAENAEAAQSESETENAEAAESESETENAETAESESEMELQIQDAAETDMAEVENDENTEAEESADAGSENVEES